MRWEGRQEGLGFQAEKVGTRAEARPVCGRGAHLTPHPSPLGGWPTGIHCPHDTGQLPDPQEGALGQGRACTHSTCFPPPLPLPGGAWRPARTSELCPVQRAESHSPPPHSQGGGMSKGSDPEP